MLFNFARYGLLDRNKFYTVKIQICFYNTTITSETKIIQIMQIETQKAEIKAKKTTHIFIYKIVFS